MSVLERIRGVGQGVKETWDGRHIEVDVDRRGETVPTVRDKTAQIVGRWRQLGDDEWTEVKCYNAETFDAQCEAFDRQHGRRADTTPAATMPDPRKAIHAQRRAAKEAARQERREQRLAAIRERRTNRMLAANDRRSKLDEAVDPSAVLPFGGNEGGSLTVGQGMAMFEANCCCELCGSRMDPDGPAGVRPVILERMDASPILTCTDCNEGDDGDFAAGRRTIRPFR